MKKVLVVLSSLVLASSLLACSNNSSNNNSPEEVIQDELNKAGVSEIIDTTTVEEVTEDTVSIKPSEMTASDFVDYCYTAIRGGEVVFNENKGYHSFKYINSNGNAQTFDYCIEITPMSDEDLNNEITYMTNTSLGNDDSIYYVKKADNVWGMYSYDTPGEIAGYTFIYNNVLINCTDFGSSNEAMYELVDSNFYNFNSVVDFNGMADVPKG